MLISHALHSLLILLYLHPVVFLRSKSSTPPFFHPICEQHLAGPNPGSNSNADVQSVMLPSILKLSLLMSRSVNVSKRLKKGRISMKGNCERCCLPKLPVHVILLCHSSIHLTLPLFSPKWVQGSRCKQ